MVYELASLKDLDSIYDVVQHTIKTIYPKYYPVENGEVSEQTLFLYHQNGSLLWAEYSGGDILKGSLIGSVSDNGELDFVYHHMNRDMMIKTGSAIVCRL